MGCEMKADYYDKVYKEEDKYRLHYKDLPYYPIFQVAVGMLSDIDNPQILELGCGTGQFAQMLWDKGYLCYKGIDFSEAAIGIATGKSPQVFEVGDVFDASYEGFNTVVVMEVLEHIENDLQLIGCIPEGMNVIFSVPNFADPSHVRRFGSKEEVEQRYGGLIDVKDYVFYQHWHIVRGVRNGTHYSQPS